MIKIKQQKAQKRFCHKKDLNLKIVKAVQKKFKLKTK